MVRRVTVIVFVLIGVTASLFAQENVTLSTYYPSPMGSYDTMEITRELTVVGPGSDTVTISSDSGGNITLNGTQDYFQLSFESDGGPVRAYSFLQPYAGGTCTCPDGYVINQYLKADKTPAYPTMLPASGYCICTRGTE